MTDGGRRRGPLGVGISLGYRAEGLDDLPKALDHAEALGPDAVEIFLPSLGVVLAGRVRPSALRRLRDACSGRRFEITLHGPLSADLGATSAPQLQRDVTRACLEVAAAIDAHVLVQHAAVWRDEPGAADAALGREREALAALAADAAAARCVLGLETMWARPGEATATGAEIAATIAAVASPWIGATLDFSHAWLNAVARGVDPMESVAAVAPHARHLHVHDSFGRLARFRPWSKGDAMAFGFGDLHLPPGAGSLPWVRFAELPLGQARIANLELDRRFDAESAEALAWTRDWIAQAAPSAGKRRASAG